MTMSAEPMASAAALTAHVSATTHEDTEAREKQFFTTWLRLMERLRDVTEISQALQSVLMQSNDAGSKLQDVQHTANLLGATDKTLTGLVTRINEFFFYDIVPALKRARQGNSSSSQHAQDSLDRYLELGDEGITMPQAFVDNMSGWGAATQGQRSSQSRGLKTIESESGIERESDTDDDIQADKLHDTLVANSLKLTATRAPEFLIQCLPQHHSKMAQDLARIHVSDAGNSQATDGKSKAKTKKRGPPSIETDLSSRPLARSAGSTPLSQSRSSSEDVIQLNDRIDKRSAASLTAEKVLGVRTYGSAREFLIRWEGVKAPLWITRRKAPPRAKELIDAYAVKSRAHDHGGPDKTQIRRTSSKGTKTKVERKGSKINPGHELDIARERAEPQQAAFYSVDHIVSHRVFNKSRQYLVRWENYDESDDTWECAQKLRADVPDMVDAYEAHLCRDQMRREKVQSATLKPNRDVGTKVIAKKRGRGNSGGMNAFDKCTRQLVIDTTEVDGGHLCWKRRRLAGDEEGHGKTAGSDSSFDDESEEASSDDSLVPRAADT